MEQKIKWNKLNIQETNTAQEGLFLASVHLESRRDKAFKEHSEESKKMCD